MTATAPKQSSLDLCIPHDVQLLHVCTVSSLLKLSSEQIFPLLGHGLEFAFDLSRRGTKHAMPLVWRKSVVDYRNGYRPDVRRDRGRTEAAEAAQFQLVLDAVLSIKTFSIRATELKCLLGYCGRNHVIRLMREGMLRPDLGRITGRGPAQSPWILRTSAMAFLRSRRIL